MTVDIPNVGKYRVLWRHHSFYDDDEMTRVTECVIEENGNADCVVSAISRCNPEDHFERNRGRKLSMTRALRKLFPNLQSEDVSSHADNREFFWQAYREHLGHW